MEGRDNNTVFHEESFHESHDKGGRGGEECYEHSGNKCVDNVQRKDEDIVQ